MASANFTLHIYRAYITVHLLSFTLSGCTCMRGCVGYKYVLTPAVKLASSSSSVVWHKCSHSLSHVRSLSKKLTYFMQIFRLGLACSVWRLPSLHLLPHLPLSILTGNNLQHSHQRGKTISPSLNLRPALADLKLARLSVTEPCSKLWATCLWMHLRRGCE